MIVINAVVWFVVGLCALFCVAWVYSLIELALIWLGWKDVDK